MLVTSKRLVLTYYKLFGRGHRQSALVTKMGDILLVIMLKLLMRRHIALVATGAVVKESISRKMNQRRAIVTAGRYKLGFCYSGDI